MEDKVDSSISAEILINRLQAALSDGESFAIVNAQLTAKVAELEKERISEGESFAIVEAELTAKVAELDKLKGELVALKDNRDYEVKELLEEGELTLSQLHQVQEQVEYYFLLSRKQSEMLEVSAKLQERAVFLLSNASK